MLPASFRVFPPENHSRKFPGFPEILDIQIYDRHKSMDWNIVTCASWIKLFYGMIHANLSKLKLFHTVSEGRTTLVSTGADSSLHYSHLLTVFSSTAIEWLSRNSRWWQLKYFLFSSLFGEDEPNLTSIFFRWVGSTTN